MRTAGLTAGLVLAMIASVSVADEAPIADLVKSINTPPQTLTVEASARGTDSSAGAKRHAATLAAVEPGDQRGNSNQGDREVAHVVRIIHAEQTQEEDRNWGADENNPRSDMRRKVCCNIASSAVERSARGLTDLCC